MTTLKRTDQMGLKATPMSPQQSAQDVEAHLPLIAPRKTRRAGAVLPGSLHAALFLSSQAKKWYRAVEKKFPTARHATDVRIREKAPRWSSGPDLEKK